MKKFLNMLFITGLLFSFGITAHAEVPKEVENSITLEADETWTGDFYVEKDINLNGHILTISGNLIQADKTINVNGGKLIVQGDYRMQGLKKDSKGVDYAQLTEENLQFCNAILKMDKDTDYVLVEGNFYPNGRGSVLRSGIVELKGDFMYTTNAYMGSYQSQGKHKTIFSGMEDQKIFFSRTGSYFNILEVHKKYGQLIFQSPIDVKAIDEDTEIRVGGNGYLYLYLYQNKDLSLGGHTLTIDGNLFLDRGDITPNGGSLIVKKDFRMESISSVSDKMDIDYSQLTKEDFKTTTTNVQLIMKNPKDYVLVEGNFVMNNKSDAIGLRAGVLELKGNFTEKPNYAKRFLAFDKHKTVLSGTQQQVVYFAYPSYTDKTGKLRVCNNFNILEIKNKDVVMAYPQNASSNWKAQPKRWANKIIPFKPNTKLIEKAITL